MTACSYRIGQGFDAHRLGGDPPLRLAGVVVDPDRGLAATSDGDLAAHAIIDSILGAAGLGDIGTLYPSSDPQWQDADSMAMLRSVVELAAAHGLTVSNLDLTIVAETVRVGPHRDAMRTRLASVLGLDVERVSVKATTTDGLGFAGRNEGVSAWAAVLLAESGCCDQSPR
ncbi:MAG: 2-C-methyl-D-erythritol 2,4-cyclodiphosphate synthase [Acidimicrobiia bacterium]|nr:2-C-methyl-D-erythritol 2,4-cyclodiphosphate synthase [bacterium]MXX65054.1 2-C-methyl-D-erythritol 2,4-cyclodiphosphate synthase [Acidimicrobiia bacterium]MCY3580059.1 2-C-methyl-D-erythritol 2,4-cyclodiphosphate synthase [bacterium]MCY3652566.1 2-C-methyl-D-erythritol 2,4-cyclodiphosphate synthase [bacterium]MDE0643862.1 2-C-methyl-D-erythritol 2,4-cyclodiphosphate synthase [bacterium]